MSSGDPIHARLSSGREASRRSCGATSATILALTASISASVRVRSTGCRRTAIATDFEPSGTPGALVDVEHVDAGDELALGALRRLDDVAGRRRRGRPRRRSRARRGWKSESASAGLTLVGLCFGSGRASSMISKATSVPLEVERLHDRADAPRRSSRSRSSGRTAACRSGRDAARPARRPRPAGRRSARRGAPSSARASALASKASTVAARAVPVPAGAGRRAPCRGGRRPRGWSGPPARRRRSTGRPRTGRRRG